LIFPQVVCDTLLTFSEIFIVIADDLAEVDDTLVFCLHSSSHLTTG
jgi:hypothetical protein